MSDGQVALVGVGTIGRGWAALFARAGFDVALYDPDPASISAARAAILATLRDLAASGLGEDPEAILTRVRDAGSLEAAAQDAFFIQESVPEDLPLKQRTLAALSACAAPDAIISSSCSSLLPEDLFRDIVGPGRCLVAHPFNPPHLLPLVELLPGPQTDEATIERARGLMRRLGQAPVVVRKPVPGYVVNRLQAAVINEAMHLVGAGVITPGDLDLCMRASLGRRWSFLGPFETMDLNADDGVAGYAARFGGSYAAIGADLGTSRPWSPEAVAAVVEACRAETPLEDLQARREWRDRKLMEMLRA